MDEKIPIENSAVVLDVTSIQRLLRRFEKLIPKGWKLITDHNREKHPKDPDRTLHMTISMGEIPFYMEKYIGLSVGLWVKDYGIENGVFAVGVDGFESKNEKPHITLAIDESQGAKPQYANKIKNWTPLKRPLKVKGKVKEIPDKNYVSVKKSFIDHKKNKKLVGDDKKD